MPGGIAVVLELLVFLAAMWLLTFLTVFLHELGHAAGYRLAAGDGHWQIRVGWGKRLIHTKRLTVGLLVFDGFFTPSEEKIDTRAKLIATLVGGPAVSLLLAAGLLVLRSAGLSFRSAVFSESAVRWFLDLLLYGNLFILLASLVPGRYLWGKVKGLETDGRQILNALKKDGH